MYFRALIIYGAEEGTRTPTPLRVHGPEPCASANSATSATDAANPKIASQERTESNILQGWCRLSNSHNHGNRGLIQHQFQFRLHALNRILQHTLFESVSQGQIRSRDSYDKTDRGAALKQLPCYDSATRFLLLNKTEREW